MDGIIRPWRKFEGKLDLKKFNRDEKRAYIAITNQKQRCNNPNRPDYKYYGALGIKVEYDIRDFMGWYLWSLSRYEFNEPSVGRIDHSRNYTFDNIQMVEMKTNIYERFVRRGMPIGNKMKLPKAVAILSPKTREEIAIFPTVTTAAKFFGYDNGQISRLCSGYTSKSSKFNFIFTFK